jgi:hypothetical protein
VTDEGVKDTEGFAKTTSMSYAYAYDKAGKLKGWAGVTGIPHAILIDVTGKVVWEGHPASLTDADITKATAGALAKPLWDWPASAKDVRAALSKRAYADAVAKAEKLTDPDAPAIKAAIQGVIASRVANTKAMFESGDFLAASNAVADLQKQLEGLPEKADIDKVAADIKANKDADKIIHAQKKVAETGEKKFKKRELDGAIAEMEKIKKELPGTCAAKQAGEMVTELNRRRLKE